MDSSGIYTCDNIVPFEVFTVNGCKPPLIARRSGPGVIVTRGSRLCSKTVLVIMIIDPETCYWTDTLAVPLVCAV